MKLPDMKLYNAAPELLKACQDVLNWAKHSNAIVEPEDEQMIRTVEAAIRLATYVEPHLTAKAAPSSEKELLRLIATDDRYEYQDENFILGRDLARVQFDFENFDYQPFDTCDRSCDGLGIRYLPNGNPYCMARAGGDWESPVCFCFYYDGTQLRAYIPKDGNVYNQTTMTAFGNDPESDWKAAALQGFVEPDEPDAELEYVGEHFEADSSYYDYERMRVEIEKVIG